jgi:hypothetical protein
MLHDRVLPKSMFIISSIIRTIPKKCCSREGGVKESWGINKLEVNPEGIVSVGT